MKRILLLLAVLTLSAAVSGPLMAQTNSFVGTWKLNTAKSKFNGQPMPKSLTREVVADGTGAKYTYKGTDSEGKAVEYSFTTNYDGKDSAITGTGAPAGADTVAAKRVGPNKSEGTLKKGGKEVGKSTSEVSKDGKVTTIRGSGKAADGKDYSTVSVYDKQ